MKKRICATFLVLSLLMSLFPASALAAEPGEEESQAGVCTCEILCAEGTVNEQCAVCMADITACTGEAPQPEAPTCTCETLCAEGAVNEQCPVCMADPAACTGEAPQLESLVCTCETLCAEGAVNEQCPVCMADPAACTGEAPQLKEPVCTCETLCAEGAVNERCPVCAEDISACVGEDTISYPSMEDKPVPMAEERVELDIKDGSVILSSGTYQQGNSEEQTIPTKTLLVITGTSEKNTIIVNPGEGNTAAFTINGLTLETAKEENLIDIQSGDVTLMLEGENTLTNDGGKKAVVHVSSSASLTIDGMGSLNIYNGTEGGTREANGAGIGGNSEEAPKAITINGGTITVTEYGTAACIGGGSTADSGAVVINGGDIDVSSKPFYPSGYMAYAGTGIGGGGNHINGAGDGSKTGHADITILGGHVTAYSGTDEYWYGMTTSGAAIGSGENRGGTILIGGDAVVHARSKNLACAIGSSNAGAYGSSEVGTTPMEITIEGNAKVTAQTEAIFYEGDQGYEPTGAAIGMSFANMQKCTITIEDNAEVTAKGGWYAAGIGGGLIFGDDQSLSINIGGNAKVDASSVAYGAGIGSGYSNKAEENSQEVTISITGNPTITATGGYGAAGIGSGKGAVKGTIDISGGSVTAYGGKGLVGEDIGGAGIGAGASDDWYGYGSNFGSIVISGDANVKAYGGLASAGIGGGNAKATYNNDGELVIAQDQVNAGGVESITITGTAQVYAVGGKGASAIGSGATYDGVPAPITEKLIISDGTTVEAYADGAKFAIDIGNTSEGAVQVTDTVLNARFAADEAMPEDSNGNHPINLLKDDKADGKLTLPKGYRAFAVTASDDSEGTIRIQSGEYSERYAYYTAEDNSKQFTYPLYENKDAAGDYCMLTKDELRWMPLVTIQPADIIIYTGGDDYDKVVDEDGNLVQNQKNGLPEPGFYVTLPKELDQELKTVLGVPQDTVLDLSPYLRFRSGAKEWTLERYDGAETSIDHGKYIYRMIAGDGQDPVRMQFKDEATGEVKISDQFNVNEVLHSHYTMSIYPGAVDQTTVYAEISNLPDGISISYTTYAASAQAGKLTIRGVTQQGGSTPVESKVEQSVEYITAVVPDGTEYYVNDSNVKVVGGKPSLLVDQIVQTEQSEQLLKEKALETLHLTDSGKLCYDFRYLDLVDADNGNTWITASKPVTVYWPYPKNTDSNTTFYLVHFDGLDRDMDRADLDNAISNCAAKKVELSAGPYGIQFTTESFSPFVLAWTEKSGGGDPDPGPGGSGGGDGTQSEFELHYRTNGGKYLSVESEIHVWTKNYEDLPVPERDGYTFAGWYWDLRLTDPVRGDIKVDGPVVVLYAKWAEEKPVPALTGVSDWLDTVNHKAFLSGYPEGTFGPDRNMTRAEVAQMFYALLLDKDVQITKTFTDVPADAWYAKAVNTLASLGMLGGYPDGTFQPDRTITRAEFAVVALAFTDGGSGASCSFTDVNRSDWFYQYAAQANEYGWIGGYPDGSFRPNNKITRAEVSVIVNNMLGRDADERFIDRNGDELVSFTDLTDGHWAYYAIMEATNTHTYTRDGSTEVWKAAT